ncbi:hypothetical protein [Kitasatospora azatica]|uniref:hypothetical protein n=1 Tax=Kitasatospora azatica TaxID=58347 RepID=UPI0005656B41|nr:hypothetical protein [Kitasatospora azatica]
MDRLTGRGILALQRAVREAATPWAELTAAVRALGQAGEAEQEHATRSVLGREFPLSLAEQLAESMADYAGRHRAALAERLRGPAGAAGAFDEDRIWAAEAIAALGPEYRGEAVAALRGAIADPQFGQSAPARAVQLRWMAAVALAQLDPELRDEAAAVVRGEDLANDGWENELARAEHLHDIGGAYADEAVRMLLALREGVDEEFAVDVDEALDRITGGSPAEPGSSTAGELSAEDSAAQLRAKLASDKTEREPGTVFVALSDAAEVTMWESVRSVEWGSITATRKELGLTPRLGEPSPDQTATSEDYVIELNPKQRHHRPLTLRYRYHPELNAILVLTVQLNA